jgi:drug/metabolite transporter (DMT)-like permease
MATRPDIPQKKSTALAFLGFTVLIWGAAPAFIRSFSLTTGPADALVIRTIAVAIPCLMLLPFFGSYTVARKDIPRLLLISLGMFGYFAGSIFGFAYVTAGVGGIIISTQPLLIALLASFFGTERITIPTIIGLVVSFAGTFYLFSGDSPAGSAHENIITGGLMIFACGFFWSIYVIFSKTLIQTYGSFKIMALSSILAALPSLAFASSTTWETARGLDRNGLLALLYLTFVGTLLTVCTWNFATARLQPTTVGASLYLIPILAIASGTALLGETVTTPTLIAGGIILCGVALAQFGSLLGLRASLAGLAAVLFAVSVWGMVPVATRFLVLDLPPQTVMILRVFPAGIVGLLMAIYLGVKPMPWQAWARIAAAALIGNVGYQVLSILGAQYIPAAWIGMLFGLEPVFIALFAVLLAGDRLTSWLVGGMVLALIGTVTLMLGNILVPDTDVGLLGIVLVTLGTMGWGIYTVLVRPVSAEYGSIQIASLTLGISAFPMLFFVTPDFPQVLQSMNSFQWLVMSFVVIFCTFLGTVAWNYALGRMSSSLAGMFLYVQPLVAAVGGIVLLDEKLSLPLVAGGLLIIAGVALAQFGPRFRVVAEAGSI